MCKKIEYVQEKEIGTWKGPPLWYKHKHLLLHCDRGSLVKLIREKERERRNSIFF